MSRSLQPTELRIQMAHNYLRRYILLRIDVSFCYTRCHFAIHICAKMFFQHLHASTHVFISITCYKIFHDFIFCCHLW